MSQHLEKLIQSVPGVVYQFHVADDGGWSFLYISEGVRELYQYSPQAIAADPSIMRNCVLDEDREFHLRSIEHAVKEVIPWMNEFRIRTASGTIKWVRGQALPERQEDGSVIWNGILVDISKIKATETHLLRLQKLYAAVIETNRLISRTLNQDDLFSGICKIAVELGGMKMAWIGIPNAAKQHLDPVARFGDGVDILDEEGFFSRLDVAEERGQAATAYSENRTILNQDFPQNPNAKRWRELGRNYGFGSSASFPILENDQPIAVLTVYRADLNGFDDESVALLVRLSSEISQALTALSGIEERKRLEEALRFRQFGLDHADEAIFWIDSEARFRDANQTACRALGYTREELLQLTVPDIDPNVSLENWPEHWQALKKNKIQHFESSQKNRGGLTFPTEVVANYFEYHGVEYSCMLVRNVTESKIMERALAESQERFNLFMDTLPAATFIKEQDGTTIYANRYMSNVVGARNWMGKSTHQLFPPELAEKMIADDRRALETGYQVVEERVPTTDGQIRTYQTHKFRIPRHDQSPLLGGIALDITERKQMEEKIWNLAYFDSLTNLPNRRMLLDRLTQALLRAKRYQNSLAVMFLDLDYFKTINDSLGHDVGDELLKEVSVRLSACVRTGDTVSRHGGDEFIILLPEITLPEDAALVADKIIKTINLPIQIAEHTLKVSTSIGIATYPVNGSDDIQDLLKKADSAMYAAKDAGRNGYRFFVEQERLLPDGQALADLP